VKKKNMTYQQAHNQYGISPYYDTDRDGVVNINDCRPLNPNEQGIFKRALGVITKDKYGQTKEEYEQEKYEKELRKAQLADLEAQAQSSGQPLPKVGVKQTAKQWLQRQAQKEIPVERLSTALTRIATPTRRVQQRVSPYVTGEQWPEPPIMQHRQQYEEPYDSRVRYQRGGTYWGKPGYLSYPPSRETSINIFKDSPKPPMQNPFKRRIRRRY